MQPVIEAGLQADGGRREIDDGDGGWEHPTKSRPLSIHADFKIVLFKPFQITPKFKPLKLSKTHRLFENLSLKCFKHRPHPQTRRAIKINKLKSLSLIQNSSGLCKKGYTNIKSPSHQATSRSP